jgi:transposase-like protein
MAKKKTQGAISRSPLRKQIPPQTKAPCPFCHSTNTELYSLFGSMLSTSQYYCQNCRTVFEYIKR